MGSVPIFPYQSSRRKERGKHIDHFIKGTGKALYGELAAA